MKIYLYGPYGRSIFCYRPYFCIFLCDQLLHSWHGLEYDSLSTFVYIFASMGEFLVVNQVYWSCDFSRRVASLVRLVHFSYGRFSAIWNSWSRLVILHTILCLWEFIGELQWKFLIFLIDLRFISSSVLCFGYVWWNVRTMIVLSFLRFDYNSY